MNKGADILSNTRLIKFIPDEWSFNPMVRTNKGEKCYVTGVDGQLVHAWSLSSWQWDWTELITGQLTLEKNTEYKLPIWVKSNTSAIPQNGASAFQVEVRFDNDFENRKIYILGGNLIQPAKSYNGWNLYEIVFTTQSNEYTELKIFALRYPVVITAALEKDAYDWIKDDYKEIDYAQIRKDHVIEFIKELILNDIKDDLLEKIKEEIIDNIDTHDIAYDVAYDIRDEVIDNVKDEIIDDLRDEIKQEILDEIKSEIAENLDD